MFNRICKIIARFIKYKYIRLHRDVFDILTKILCYVKYDLPGFSSTRQARRDYLMLPRRRLRIAKTDVCSSAAFSGMVIRVFFPSLYIISHYFTCLRNISTSSVFYVSSRAKIQFSMHTRRNKNVYNNRTKTPLPREHIGRRTFERTFFFLKTILTFRFRRCGDCSEKARLTIC